MQQGWKCSLKCRKRQSQLVNRYVHSQTVN
jgi:hypothetical protein